MRASLVSRRHGARTLMAVTASLVLAWCQANVRAQEDPPGCDSTGVGITIQARVGGAATTGPVDEGDAIVYRVTVSHPGGTACNFQGGQLSLTLPDNTLVQLAGFGGATPNVPLITDISPFQIDSPVAYIADPADRVLSGAQLVLVARTDYGSTGFRPGQVNGTFFTDPPQQTASASTSIPLGVLFCGDGIVQPPEECDDGNQINTDGCRNDCTLPFCGDGILDVGEECDDGNNMDGDGCNADCMEELCGDGVVQPPEECDDGNQINTDGCRNDCTLPFCGDGILDAGEQCDDGNNMDGDGCSATCEEEGEFAGCTPGFWKQPHHLIYWTNYDPDDLYDDVFGVTWMPELTLLEALQQGGGGAIALGRHSVAALLNAASPEVDYFYTEAEIIALVQEAHATGDFHTAHYLLAQENERGCTVDKSRDGKPESGASLRIDR